MRRISKLPWLFLILALIAGYLLIISKAKDYLANIIEEKTNAQASIGAVTVGFPLKLQLNNLRLFEKADATSKKEFFYAERIAIAPSVLSFFTRRFIIKELQVDYPRIELIKDINGSYNFSNILIKDDRTIKKNTAKANSRSLILLGLSVRDGQVKYIDRSIAKEIVELIVDNIDIHISKLAFPFVSLKTNFSASGDIPAQSGYSNGDFLMKGWIDVFKKDLDADIKLNNIDIRYVKPYLMNLLASNIDSGAIFFYSKITAKDNDLIADCKLNIKDIEFITIPEELTLFGLYIGKITELIKDEQKELSVDFTIKTKLDAPRLKITKVSGNLISTGLKSAVSAGVEQILKKADEGADKTGEAAEKLKEVGKELKELLKDILQ